MRWMPLVALIGCSSDVGSARNLEGTWLSQEGSTLRGLVVEPREASGWPEHTYRFYLYEDGESPEPVQSGLLSVIGGELVYDVREDVDPFHVGQRFASELERLGRNRIRVQGRDYERVDVLPGPVDRVLAFGQVEELGIVDGASDLAVLESGDVWTLGGFPQRLQGVRGDESLDAGIFRGASALLPWGDDLGWLDEQGRLARYDVVEVPPARAGAAPSYAFEPVWTSDSACVSAASVTDAWVGLCLRGSDVVLAWFDPEDGTIIRELPSSDGSVWSLGEDVLVQERSASPRPDLHGERSDNGWLLRRIRADGSVVFQHWSPGMRILGDVVAVDEVDVLYSGQILGDVYAGVPTPDATGRHVLTRLGADGEVWEREIPSHRAGFAPLVGLPGGGFVVGVSGRGDDLGLGPIGSSSEHEALALLRMDACGEWEEQVVYEGDRLDGLGGTALATGFGWHPDGGLLAGMAFSGLYDVDGREVGFVNGGGVGVIARLGEPASVADCVSPGPHVVGSPVIELTIEGQGSVHLGDQTCETTCTVELERYQEVVVEVGNGDGWQLGEVDGACASLPCVVHADEPSQSLRVAFQALDADLVPVSDRPSAMASGQSVVFLGGTISPSQQATIDGVVVADGPGGQSGYLAVLDGSGLLGSVGLPPSDNVVYDLIGMPGQDVGVALMQTGNVHRFDASGLLTTVQVPAGPTWRKVAVDGLGNLAVLGVSSQGLEIAATDGTWTAQVSSTSSVVDALALVGRSGGGFTVVGYGGDAAVLPDGTVLSGALGDLVYLHLDATGVQVSGRSLPGVGPQVAGFPAWETPTGVAMVKTTSWSVSPPVGDVFVEVVDDAGVVQSTVGLPFVSERVYPTAAGFVGTDAVRSSANPFGGAPLNHAGGADRLIAWFGATGAHRDAATLGSVGDESGGPAAVLPDGTVFAFSAVGGNGGTTVSNAIGVFASPP